MSRTSRRCGALGDLSHPKSYRTTGCVDDAKGTTETVGSLVDSCMRFTLTGERVDGPKMPVKGSVTALLPNINADMRRSTGAPPCWRLMDKQSSWECEGATWLDHDGYPCYHETMDNLLMYCKNFRVNKCCPVAGAEILRRLLA